MKKILLLILVLISYTINSQSIERDTEKMYLKDKVESVENRMFEAIVVNGEVTSGNSFQIDFFDSNWIITFDNNGKFLSGFYLDVNGEKGRINIDTKNFRYTELNEFNINGLKILYINGKQKGKNVTSEKFDQKGNLTEYTVLNEDGSFQYKVLHKYDKHNNVIEEKTYLDRGKLESITICDFDKNHNIISYSQRDGNLKITFDYTYKYEYDEHNNWIKKIESNKIKPVKVVERKITYF